jgi:hypothetical protein
MTDVAAKLPDMADTELTVLHANAERLERTGTPVQRTAASALIPAIQAELTARRAAKLSHAKAATSAATAPKRRTKRKDS